jgi:hypothetical protein
LGGEGKAEVVKVVGYRVESADMPRFICGCKHDVKVWASGADARPRIPRREVGNV